MSDVKIIPLVDALDFREGPGIMAVDFRQAGVPLIRLAGLKSGANILAGCNYLDPGKVAAKWQHFRVEEGDVLLSTSASLGEVAVVGAEGVGAVPYTGIIRFRPKDNSIVQEFIQYALRSPSFKQQIIEMGVGSVMNHFGPSHLRHMTVNLPTIEQQRGIAEVLGALDDKIAANARLASTGWALAKAAFAQLQQAATTDVAVGEILTLEYGKSLPASARMPGNVAVFGSGGSVGVHDTALVDRPGIVIGRKGSAGSVHWAPGPHFPIDTTFFVVPAAADVPLTFCYFALASLRLDEMNSDSAVPGLNRGAAHAAKVRLPDAAARMTFDATAGPLFVLAAQIEHESGHLAKMRDALLPQLMSGKIRVKDAERVVEGVV